MRAALPALLAVLLLTAGCRTASRGSAAAEKPEDRCRRMLAACPPPAHVAPGTDVAALDVRQLVHLASRTDVGGLSAAAAKRLRKLASDGEPPLLLEIEAAIDDADAQLGKCRCEETRTEIDRKGIREIVRSRVPPRVMRSPETWTEWIVARLATLRDLGRRSAVLAVGPAPDVRELDVKTREAEKDLCEAVHAARAMLSPEAFQGMLKAVYLRREADAGAGSAESARQTVGAYARADSCDAAPAKPAD